MKMKQLLGLVLAVSSLVLIGCPPKEGGVAGGGAEGGEILVGEYGSMTGAEATFGLSTHNGIMMAVDEINAAGGVKGKKIKILTEDDQSKPEEAANVVQKLISQNQVVAVLGEVASSNSLAAAPICQQNKVPMITPSSTNPKVTQIGDYIFRVCFLDSYQGDALANFVINDLKMKKAAILKDVKSDYSVGLSDFFKQSFVKRGGKIVADQSYAKGDSDFKGQLTSIKAANPDVIFSPGYYTDVGQIAIQLRDLGMKQPLVGGDGWESPKLIEIGGKSLEGSFYSNHYFAEDQNPSVRSFVEKYRQRYGAAPDSLAALGYDATKILAEAMKRAKDLTGPSIRDEIAKTRAFPGVTGTITIGPDRNAVKGLVVVEVKDGRLTLKSSVASPDAPAAAATTTAATTTTGTAPGTATSPAVALPPNAVSDTAPRAAPGKPAPTSTATGTATSTY